MMKRALGKNCESKYQVLEYFYKSNSGLLFATDAHICLVCRDNKLAPGHYDTAYHPVKRGDWLACDVEAMFEKQRHTITQISDTITRIGDYYFDPRQQLKILSNDNYIKLFTKNNYYEKVSDCIGSIGNRICRL